MKTTLKILLLGLTCFTPQVFAHPCDGVIAKETQRDPFFKMRLMSTGPYEGECLANEKRRDITLLSNSNRAAIKVVGPLKRDRLYFANFRHRNRFYIAEYEPGSIEKVELVFEKFIEGALLPRFLLPQDFKGSELILTGHIQLRFHLKAGKELKLYDQLSQERIKSPVKVDDFSYAMYAIRPESLLGTTYDPFGEGRSEGYAMSHNFLSTHDVAIEYQNYTEPERARVGQYKLEASALDFEKTLRALLKQSHDLYHSESAEIYDTIKNNCVTATYTGIVAGDKKIGRSGPRWYRFYSRHLIANETGGREYNPMSVFADLERRKILTHRKQSKLKDFNDEICEILEKDFRPPACTR